MTDSDVGELWAEHWSPNPKDEDRVILDVIGKLVDERRRYYSMIDGGINGRLKYPPIEAALLDLNIPLRKYMAYQQTIGQWVE